MDVCPICKDCEKCDIELDCHHKFCKKCIITWRNISLSCPICRQVTIELNKKLSNKIITRKSWREKKDEVIEDLKELFNKIVDFSNVTIRISILIKIFEYVNNYPLLMIETECFKDSINKKIVELNNELKNTIDDESNKLKLRNTMNITKNIIQLIG